MSLLDEQVIETWIFGAGLGFLSELTRIVPPNRKRDKEVDRMELTFALYRSKAKRPITQKTIIDILAKSVRNNNGEGLTGFLHTDHDHFLQYLEGPPATLMRKLARIRKDHRHKNFMILAEGVLDERLFPDWDMGQISQDILPFEGLLSTRSWLQPTPDIDPLPLLQAFAAHAGRIEDMAIVEIE